MRQRATLLSPLTSDGHSVREAGDAPLNVVDGIIQHCDLVRSHEYVTIWQQPQDREQIAVELRMRSDKVMLTVA